MAAELVTVPGVELIKVGIWEILSGEWTVTPEKLASAVAAHGAGVLRKPILKLGHIDPRFDGEPAVGWVDNLRVAGDTLLGDYVGVPRWLAEILASAYPDRSIEGLHDYRAPGGTVYPFLVTAVALLGVAEPGISTLRSLQGVRQLYDVAASAAGGAVCIRVPGTTDTRRRVLVRAAAARRRGRRAVEILARIDCN